MPELTAECLRAALNYDPDTGEFRWRAPRKSIRVGDLAGKIVSGTGYRSIKIDGRQYLAHRLAWLYINGVWPSEFIDHINGSKDDNRWANLREATRTQNAANQGVSRANRSGYKGVHWHINMSKWVAAIKVHGRRKHLGYFDKIEDAAHAYAVAAPKFHGKFARI